MEMADWYFHIQLWNTAGTFYIVSVSMLTERCIRWWGFEEILSEFYMRYYNTMPWISPFVIAALVLRMIFPHWMQSTTLRLVWWDRWPYRRLPSAGQWYLQFSDPLRQACGDEEIHWESSYGRHLPFVFLVVRILQYEWGYGMGVTVCHTKFGKQITVFTEACSVLGLTVVGSLVATVVKLSTVCSLKRRCRHEGSGADWRCYAGTLPVAAVGIIYYFMKVKKVKWPGWFCSSSASMIGAATGIFTAILKEGLILKAATQSRSISHPNAVHLCGYVGEARKYTAKDSWSSPCGFLCCWKLTVSDYSYRIDVITLGGEKAAVIKDKIQKYHNWKWSYHYQCNSCPFRRKRLDDMICTQCPGAHR